MFSIDSCEQRVGSFFFNVTVNLECHKVFEFLMMQVSSFGKNLCCGLPFPYGYRMAVCITFFASYTSSLLAYISHNKAIPNVPSKMVQNFLSYIIYTDVSTSI